MKKCEIGKSENDFVKWYFIAVMTIVLIVGSGYLVYNQGYKAGFKEGEKTLQIKYNRLQNVSKELAYLNDKILVEIKENCRIAKQRNHDCIDYLKNL